MPVRGEIAAEWIPCMPLLDVGAGSDPQLLKTADDAHLEPIGSIGSVLDVSSMADCRLSEQRSSRGKGKGGTLVSTVLADDAVKTLLSKQSKQQLKKALVQGCPCLRAAWTQYAARKGIPAQVSTNITFWGKIWMHHQRFFRQHPTRVWRQKMLSCSD